MSRRRSSVAPDAGEDGQAERAQAVLGEGQAHMTIALSEHSLRALALVILTNVGDAAC